MNRRTFLNSALVFMAGAGAATALGRLLQDGDTSVSLYDTERRLLAFYDPAMTSLPQLFPEIESYADALQALQQRGLLVNGYLHTEQITVLAESDPIVDYLGWQHLESELLVYLAANLLVSESRGAGSLKAPRNNDTTEAGKTVLLQNAGNRHVCWLIKDPVPLIKSPNHIAGVRWASTAPQCMPHVMNRVPRRTSRG